VTTLFFEPKPVADETARKRVFAGGILVQAPTPASLALCRWARQLLAEAFGGADPQKAQFDMPVEKFVGVAGAVKTRFTNHAQTKDLVRALLAERGCDMERTYFDVPRLRVVTHGEYLTAGVGYAYKAHRDTWYASPTAQLNWWVPVYDLESERSLAFYPEYWSKPLRNSSAEFDYGEWCAVGRAQAASQVKTDTRKHPLPQEPVETQAELRVVCETGAVIHFSSSQLHATVPNSSGVTRFSFDFRSLNADDLLEGRGAHNIDAHARGSTLGDFLRASDLAPFPTPAA